MEVSLPTKSRTQPSYHHGNLREAALAAARTLLEERGPSFLVVKEIARRLGVSDPALYHHFPNRDALALALIQQGSTELSNILVRAAEKSETGFLGLGEAYVSFAVANPALYRLMFGEGFAITSNAAREASTLRQNIYRLLKDRMDTTKGAPSLHAATFLWSVAHGLAMLLIDKQMHSTDLPTADFTRAVLSLARYGIAGSGQADG
jgi:AcrR family transcriptional regulator